MRIATHTATVFEPTRAAGTRLPGSPSSALNTSKLTSAATRPSSSSEPFAGILQSASALASKSSATNQASLASLFGSGGPPAAATTTEPAATEPSLASLFGSSAHVVAATATKPGVTQTSLASLFGSGPPAAATTTEPAASEPLIASLFGSSAHVVASGTKSATTGAAASQTALTAAPAAAGTSAAAQAAAITAAAAITVPASNGAPAETPGIQALVSAIMGGSIKPTYVTDPSQLQETNPAGTDHMPNFYYASAATANQLASMLGGTVVQMTPFGQDPGWTEPLANFIQLPNGQTFNAADIAYYANCGSQGAAQLTADLTSAINEGAAFTNYYANGGRIPIFAEGYVGPPISGMTYPAGSIGSNGSVINPAMQGVNA